MFRWIPLQTFRYLACGGSNTVLSIIIYHLSYTIFLGHTYVAHNQHYVHLFSSVNIDVIYMAGTVSQAICIPIGFILSRHIVFPESNIHGRVQLFRYLMVTASFIIMNYVLLDVFEKIIPFVHPTIRAIFVSLGITILSYISQRVFTFKTVHKAVVIEDEAVMVE